MCCDVSMECVWSWFSTMVLCDIIKRQKNKEQNKTTRKIEEKEMNERKNKKKIRWKNLFCLNECRSTNTFHSIELDTFYWIVIEMVQLIQFKQMESWLDQDNKVKVRVKQWDELTRITNSSTSKILTINLRY